MRGVFIVIALLASQVLFGQLIVKPIQKNETKNERQTIKIKRAPSVLPFWDDFSITKNTADSIRIWGNDTTSQWDYNQSKDVYINATLAIKPPTYNVATFDGLDQYGMFHTENPDNLADQLQSDTIDLSGFNKDDSIYISFYWQAGGNVEMPNEGDLLHLQFYNPADVDGDPWTTFWSQEGSDTLSNSKFTQEIMMVEQGFLTNKFVFRFQSFGNTHGPFDAWHIDWVYMNAGRSEVDLLNGYDDGALSGELSSPITPFSSIPVHQFTSDNKYIRNQSIAFSYLNRKEDVEEIFPIRVSYIVTLTNNDFTILLDTGKTSNFLNWELNYVEETLGLTDIPHVFLRNQDFSQLNLFDSVVLETLVYLKEKKDTIVFNNSIIDLSVNDSLRVEYLLHNYYAYDDGSAEYAAGTNKVGGQVAVQFWVEEPDTLSHVAFHFPNIEPSASGKPITLKIFKSLDDEIPQRSQQITIKNDSMINGFTYYKLDRPLIVSDTFFIAYEQNTSDYIGVGFDRSNPEASKYIFENKGIGWERNDRLQGALMIRAIFEEIQDYTLGTTEPKKLMIFPNPTDGIISIEGKYTHIELFNLSGMIFFKEKAKPQHDFSNLEGGLYLLKIHQLDGERTYKIIKK
jgi:hypothetical protein